MESGVRSQKDADFDDHTEIGDIKAFLTPDALRVLALVASPRGQPPIDVRRALQSLRRLHEPGRIDVTIAPHASAAGLPGLIERAQPDMVIFLAHGRPGALILEDATGESETLRANDLATLLAARPGCTVVLASCYGATPDDAGRSTAL